MLLTACYQKLSPWLYSPLDRRGRAYLESHLDLLDAESDEFLELFIAEYKEKPEEQRRLRLARHILRDASERGRTTEAVRDTYINVFGGLILDPPAWLQEIEQQWMPRLAEPWTERRRRWANCNSGARSSGHNSISPFRRPSGQNCSFYWAISSPTISSSARRIPLKPLSIVTPPPCRSTPSNVIPCAARRSCSPWAMSIVARPPTSMPTCCSRPPTTTGRRWASIIPASLFDCSRICLLARQAYDPGICACLFSKPMREMVRKIRVARTLLWACWNGIPQSCSIVFIGGSRFVIKRGLTRKNVLVVEGAGWRQP